MTKILLLNLVLLCATWAMADTNNTLPEEPVILTPPAPLAPRINGPKVYGVRPARRFFTVSPAPASAPDDIFRQKFAGRPDVGPPERHYHRKISAAGTNRVTLIAHNAHGEAQREFRIVVGDRLALTPPMGWNSWYIYFNHVTEAAMRQAADQMIASGMADYGYQYVNIDDCWAMKPGSTNPIWAGRRATAGRFCRTSVFPT